ncbi:MAG: efflux RND transporter permease subunit, partial [Candidatus Binataceae bacterium]
ILVSGFVSLTLTPMLCSLFLRPPQSETHTRLYNLTEHWFDQLLDAYRSSLAWVMRHRRSTMMVLLLLVVGTFYGFYIIPKGFLPQEDTGQILMFTKAAQGISFDSMVKHQMVLNRMLAKDPNVETYFSSVGAAGANSTLNSGIIFCSLKPFPQRKLSVDQIMNKWRGEFSKIPGLLVFLQNPPPIQIGARFTESQYQMTLQSPNTDELFKYAPMLERKMLAMHDLRGVTSDLQIKNPQVNVEIDRNKAHALGVSAQAVENALADAYSSRQISTIYAPNDEFWVEMELEPRYQDDPNTLGLLYVRSSGGTLVPLDTIAHVTRSLGPLSINHSGQLPSVTISFDVAPGVSLGKALSEVKTVADDTLPASTTSAFSGQAQAFESSVGNLGMLLILAILVIYLVLGILYESFIHPITILSGLPAAGFGALLTLMIFHMELNLLSFVGVIMLVGLVKKNAIMMIDFALDAQRTENRTAAEAIYEGSIIRFRPIMMTTMAALMGVMPIALGIGAGAEARRPLGVAVVGGLLFSQLLTLYVTPVVYTYMDSFQQWIGRGWHPATTVATEPAALSSTRGGPRRRAAS